MHTKLNWEFSWKSSIHYGIFKEKSYYEITLVHTVLPASGGIKKEWIGSLTPDWVSACARIEIEPGLYNSAGEIITDVPDSLITHTSSPLTTHQELHDSMREIKRVFQEDFDFKISRLIQLRRLALKERRGAERSIQA